MNICFSGTFRWEEERDKLLLREVKVKQPYLYRIGSKESKQKWSEIATALNTHPDFAIQPTEQRSVRERFYKIHSEFKAKMRSEEKESGISPDEPTENEKLLEKINEIIISNNSSPIPVGKERKREKALAVRKKAMETWGKKGDKEDEEEDCQIVKRRKRTRRSSTDPMDYLKMKKETKMEMKNEEMVFMKEKVALEEKKLAWEQKRQNQMQEQLLLQQRQMQQQMDAQAQSQSLILAMLQKMNK